jgi:hypothetical protein
MHAAIDHRFFRGEDGSDSRFASLPRKERRRLEAAGRKVAERYQRIVRGFNATGAGYPADQLLRQLATEYTHRHASSGLHTQPLSFNYFEAFCDIQLIDGSVAPYAQPVAEIDHICPSMHRYEGRSLQGWMDVRYCG